MSTTTAPPTVPVPSPASGASSSTPPPIEFRRELPFVETRAHARFRETRAHARFREFAEACTAERHVGMCFGRPGVGKTRLGHASMPRAPTSPTTLRPSR